MPCRLHAPGLPITREGKAPKTQTAHRSLDLVPIPELGVKAGGFGVVDFVYDDGRGLHVEIGREDGTTAGFVQLEAKAETDSACFWRAVAYSPFEV